MKIYYPVLLFCLIVFNIQNSYSQEEKNREKAIKIFYDCDYCDEDFIKKELTYVNYVRDSKEAQVHVLITEQNNGGGGEKFTFFFIGMNEFKGQNDTLTYSSPPDATSDDIRQNQLKILKMGLMRYVAKTPLASRIKITYEDEGNEEDVKDKWNSWVFDLNLSGFLNGEKLYKYSSVNSSVNITRVTPDLKFEANARLNYNEQKYDVGDSIIVNTRNSKYFEHLLVKSINDHWSMGYYTEIKSSIYSNYNLNVIVAPALEYNIFPYAESNRRQLRLLYHLGAVYSRYIDSTIYDKTREFLFGQKLIIATEFKEKWGSISFDIQGSSYLNNFKYNNIEINTSVRIRIVKGLSFRVYGGASLVHDQLNLPKGDVSKEDILLQRKQLASQYNYWGSLGLTYTFGSIYNNVVNPRFGN